MKQTFEEALNAHLLSASRVVEHARELKAVRSLTDALQALEGRLADVEASVGQPGPLDALENRVERLEGHIEHRAWTAITERVAKLEREAVIRADRQCTVTAWDHEGGRLGTTTIDGWRVLDEVAARMRRPGAVGRITITNEAHDVCWTWEAER